MYTVSGKPSWGHKLEVYNQSGEYLATLKEQILTFLPKYHIIVHDNIVGTITKEFTFFKPSFSVDCNGWHVEGDFFQWDYSILSAEDRTVARIEKQLFRLTDTYIIDVAEENDCLLALMVVLSIDAIKCSQNK
ncbi:LURP-one-related family protein [Clostridium sp. E02]|uniref:LURP-one-related/scramblase family protein n=1 Tax=Clostridium sp. E02 TaxID=2487134 RepID=UPI000F542327|nr:LURP-one-related family protein [Clostridium sp. E02]